MKQTIHSNQRERFVTRDSVPALPTCEECDVVIAADNDPGEFLITPGGEHERVCVSCLKRLQSDVADEV